ncbi:MAG: hypothetical protein JWN36_1773 [Microbacteriaceae bacterium]|nr:hypothetical protein [Microbacteriaceae bacterium]
MIAVSLTVRSAESALWLDLVRHRLRRFDPVRVDATESIASIPGIGTILIDDRPARLVLGAVAADHRGAENIRAALLHEIAAAVPESTAHSRLTLEWSYPDIVPVRLRG